MPATASECVPHAHAHLSFLPCAAFPLPIPVSHPCPCCCPSRLQQAFGPMPSPRTQHSAVLLSPGIILIFGGCNSAGTFFNDATVLDTRTFTWTRPSLLNTVPAPRYHHTCNVLNGRILIYGGINSKQTFDGVVVVETKFLSDITSVAEELFRMSADTGMSLPGPSPRAPPSQISFTTPIATPTHQGQAQQQQQLQQQQQHTQQQQQQQPVMVVPGPMVSTAECLLNSAKSLESVKVQLTDLLLRRNLEEQQIQTARKAEVSRVGVSRDPGGCTLSPKLDTPRFSSFMLDAHSAVERSMWLHMHGLNPPRDTVPG